jgi:hypothetical protein
MYLPEGEANTPGMNLDAVYVGNLLAELGNVHSTPCLGCEWVIPIRYCATLVEQYHHVPVNRGMHTMHYKGYRTMHRMQHCGGAVLQHVRARCYAN